MERPNQVMSKQQIMDIVWGHGLDANESRVIDNHLCRLRAKLDGGYEKKYISTRRGAGYTFVNQEDEKKSKNSIKCKILVYNDLLGKFRMFFDM